MAENYDAGAIIVKLQAQIDSLQKGISQAKATLKGFGDQTQQTSKTTKQSGEQIGATFDAIDKRSIRMSARFAALTQRMVGLQFAMGALQQAGGKSLGKFQTQVESLSAGMTGFAASVAAFPNVFGIGLGAVLGLGAAFKTLSNRIEEAEQKSRELGKRLADNVRKINAGIAGREVDEFLDPGIPAELGRQRDDAVTRLRSVRTLRQNALTEQQAILLARQNREIPLEEKLNQLLAKRAEIEKKIADFRKGAGGVRGAGLPFQDDIARVDKEIKDVGETLRKENARLAETSRVVDSTTESAQGLERQITDLNAALADTQASKAFNDRLKDFDKQAEIVEESLKANLITPLEAIERRAKIAEERLLHLISNPKLAQFTQIEGARADLAAATDPLAAALAYDESTQKEQQAGIDRVRKQREKDNLERNVAHFNARFTEPFSQAIGFGIADGIMSGASSLETLAGIGRNLFANFMNDSIQNFQKGMTAAFESIAGAGGEVLGSVLTGVVGILGGLLSRGRGSSRRTYGDVRSQIESTQAVRGIVAGPSSVAIAQVGEDIGRAMVPVVQRLDQALAVLRTIARNTRGGAGGGGGGGGDFPAVAASTP